LFSLNVQIKSQIKLQRLLDFLGKGKQGLCWFIEIGTILINPTMSRIEIGTIWFCDKKSFLSQLARLNIFKRATNIEKSSSDC
jgi:hypothetical protein